MALYSRITNWVSNQVLTASALNGEFNNILNNALMSKLIGFSASVGQMQQQTTPGGVGSESLAGSASDEVQRLRFMLAYIMGTTYWYDQTDRNFGAGNLAVQTADIAAGAVTDAKVASGIAGSKLTAGSVSYAKLSNPNIVSTLSSGTYGSPLDTAFHTVSNLAVNFTATGRPFVMELTTDFTNTFSSEIECGSSFQLQFLVQQGSTTTVLALYSMRDGSFPPSCFRMISFGGLGAGAYNCFVQVACSASSGVSVLRTTLVVYEM